MYKYIIYLFITGISYSQINSASVTYGISIGEDDLISKSEFNSSYKSAIENAKYVEFSLNISNLFSEFKIKQGLENSNSGIGYSKIFSGYTSSIYTDIGEKKMYQSYDSSTLGKYVLVKDCPKYNWELTTESKNIEGFLCYKATTDDLVVNKEGTFTFKIVAWYTPQIPIPQGPLYFGGLPGLILELDRRNIVFGAKKIEINPNYEILLEKPNYKNLRTESEVKKMKEDFLNNKE